MRLSDLVDDLDLPDTWVADTAWPQAVRRTRRRRAVVGVTAAAAVAAVVVGVSLVSRSGTSTAPPATPPTAVPSDVVGTAIVTTDLTGPELGGDELERLVDQAAVYGSAAAPLPLSEHPVDHAVFAVGRGDAEVLVMGPDARYRTVDAPGLVPARYPHSRVNPLTSMSLSPDATRLALPQPDELAVVDLRTGSVERFPVRGITNIQASWVSDDEVLVVRALVETGLVVDLATGSVTPSAYGPATDFAADERPLTWPHGIQLDGLTHLTWGDGSTVTTTFDVDSLRGPVAPVLGDGFAVGPGYVDFGSGAPSTGPVVVDTSTGDPLAFQPTGRTVDTTLLGLEDDGQVLMAVRQGGTAVVTRWDWRTLTLDPLLMLPGGDPYSRFALAWGHGWDELEAAN